jgi:predicted ester cyclase
MSEHNKQLVRDQYDCMNRGDFEGLAALLDEHIAYHGSGGDEQQGRADVVGVGKRYKTAFPDLVFELPVQVAEGDHVASLVLATGTFTGELMDMAPTGKRFDITYMQLVRVQNGQVAEEWEIYDTADFMGQLGLA